jgi:hypothetical protein
MFRQSIKKRPSQKAIEMVGLIKKETSPCVPFGTLTLSGMIIAQVIGAFVYLDKVTHFSSFFANVHVKL